jgi:hypothetical protein
MHFSTAGNRGTVSFEDTIVQLVAWRREKHEKILESFGSTPRDLRTQRQKSRKNCSGSIATEDDPFLNWNACLRNRMIEKYLEDTNGSWRQSHNACQFAHVSTVCGTAGIRKKAIETIESERSICQARLRKAMTETKTLSI